MRQPFETMPTVLTSEEIIDKAYRDNAKSELEMSDRVPAIVKAKRREAARIKIIEETTAGYIEGLVKSVPTIEKLHPFYSDLLEILVGTEKTKAALGRLSRTARIIREAGKSANGRLRSVRGSAAAGLIRRSYFGRVASLVRAADADLRLVAELREKMKDLPTADPSMPTVVLAGYPGVGKSTIVRALSSAKPETRTYPFTTKEIIIGHVRRGYMTFQIVDTPGILDKPLSKRSKVELLSISAFGRLSNVIAFIVDVSEGNEFSLESQRGLYDDVAGALKDTPMKVFFNKVDLATKEQLAKAESIFGQCDRLSALKGDGLNALAWKLESALKEAFSAS